jgi:NAD(P)-dependent dehydrogenase (short-subunit alcohol dehydrogenase family)
MIDYHNTTALITGGASGIGKALAQALVARGARVILADINGELLATTGKEVGAAHTIITDLAEPAAPAQLVASAFAIDGRLDLVCSNAGIGHRRRVLEEDFDNARLMRLFNVNLFAGLRIAQAYAVALKEAHARGRLLLTCSENSLSVPAAIKGAQLGMYAATKHALLIAAEWLRDETQGDPFAVHALMPGAVYTPLVSRGMPDPALAPKELDLIMPARCAAVALQGMDLDLFYIPTQPHLAVDMGPRYEGVNAAVRALGLASQPALTDR